MTVSNICVGIVLFIVILVITSIYGCINMWLADEDSGFAMFVAWIISTAGLTICLIIIFIQNNFI